ncbi:MAG: aminotransferase class IV [Bacteroidales bacterium]|nr:aminotransferase class IV [Bacteroidales bacterium]MDT8430361.1 aminotransferase class IV [Bacteroidales bacterium]
MENIRGNTLILDGVPAAVSDYVPDAAAGMYYEVIRLIDGKLLFADDHLERLGSSCRQAAAVCPDHQTLLEHLHLLLQHASIRNGNIKLVLFKRLEKIHIACFFIPHFYPSDQDYLSGVRTRTYAFERPDPTIKRWNEDFRHNVNQFISEENIYEAILQNGQGQLNEGSRSNLFFIDAKSRIFTAPGDMILPGITRKYVLQICRELQYEVIEQALSLESAANMESCFISGTSPKVLPVSQLDDLKFDTGSTVIRTIMAAYDRLISAY